MAVSPYCLPDSACCYIISTNPLHFGAKFMWTDNWREFPRWSMDVAMNLVPKLNSGRYGDNYKPYKIAPITTPRFA